MKTVGNGRENTLTISVFIFLFGNGNGNGKARTGKRNRVYGISEMVQFGRKHFGYGRESIVKNGNTDTYITTVNVQLNAMDTSVHDTLANKAISV